MLVHRYELSLCHTPIKSDLLGFSGIDVFACGLLDNMFERFASSFLILQVSQLGFSCFEKTR